MLARLKTLTLLGLDAEEVSIEVDLHHCIGKFSIVGLGDTAVQEAKERVRSAIKNSNFDFPGIQISVNLAPADLKKYGPRFDVPIALGILHASGQIRLPKNIEEMIFLGELGFGGELRAIPGILPTASGAADRGFKDFFCPIENASEAALIENITVHGAHTLREICDHVRSIRSIEPTKSPGLQASQLSPRSDYDFSHIRGNEHAKRALEIAAAGGHNVLMSGPPGSGKTMLAQAFSTILPRLTVHEALEITKLHSIAGLIDSKQPIALQRPFRSVHHTASGVAIVGGGNPPRPGEISLSHRGVLFLDELPEFHPKTLETLRQPLENGVVTVSRSSGSCTFPAQIMLIAAMNPCPCGFAGDSEKECTCPPHSVMRYRGRLSGPLLDRIDLHIQVPRIPFEKLSGLSAGEDSTSVRERVQQARNRQEIRFQEEKGKTNAEMSSPLVKKYCIVDEQTQQLLRSAATQMNLSGRAYYRILKLARTIADLADEKNIALEHVAEAIQYRERKD
jgi:magnesium chelatase family protein